MLPVMNILDIDWSSVIVDSEDQNLQVSDLNSDPICEFEITFKTQLLNDLDEEPFAGIDTVYLDGVDISTLDLSDEAIEICFNWANRKVDELNNEK